MRRSMAALSSFKCHNKIQCNVQYLIKEGTNEIKTPLERGNREVNPILKRVSPNEKLKS